MKISIREISKRYRVEKIEESNIEDVLELTKGNPNYYDHIKSKASIDEIRGDMKALPPGKEYDDKYFVAFYDGKRLAAVMDLISGYPYENTAYIGFFMMNKFLQGKGIGTGIINDTISYLKELGFSFVELAYVSDNEESRGFWYKNKFEPKDEKEVDMGRYKVVRMIRKI